MKLAMLAGLACAMTVAQAAEPLAPGQFDWQQGIRIDAPDEAVYRFDLPAAVHAGSRRNDLGDLRIFNAAGEVVPHALLDHEPPPSTEVVQVPVPFFPLRRAAEAGDGSLSVSVRQIASGALVSAAVNSSTPAQSRLVGYVIDASRIRDSRRALFLDWQPQPNGTVVSVQIDGGDDLQTWRQIGAGTQLVDLHSGDQHLQHKRIDLAGSAYKYFRLRWPEAQDGIVVASMTLETGSTGERPDRMLWAAAERVRPGGAPGEFLFDSAALPVAALRINLPQVNTVTPLQIDHRRNDREAWREAANSVAYRLMRNGDELRSPPIGICCTADRTWRIRFDQRGGGIGQGLPGIEVGWRPQQGLFVARGPGPFLLAYGNPGVAPASFDASTLIPGYKVEQYPRLTVAMFETPIARSDTVAAAAETTAIKWRTLALWGVLIAGVMLLATMVWHLLRQMGRSPGSSAD
jgi:hypothetical protein